MDHSGKPYDREGAGDQAVDREGQEVAGREELRSTRELAGSGYTTLECGRGASGLFASHGTTLVLIESLGLAVAACDRDGAEASLGTLNDLRAALAGRRVDIDVR